MNKLTIALLIHYHFKMSFARLSTDVSLQIEGRTPRMLLLLFFLRQKKKSCKTRNFPSQLLILRIKISFIYSKSRVKETEYSLGWFR